MYRHTGEPVLADLLMRHSPAQNQTVILDDLYTALGIVTGEVTHEVVHTLTFLRYLVDLAQDDAPQGQETMSFARKEIARLERLLGNLRRFSLVAPQIEIVQLVDVARQVLASLENQEISERHRGAVDIPTGLRVRGDPGFITQILRNLLGHVRDTAGPNGTFGLRAVVTKTEKGADANLIAWDNGSAIAPAARASLFLPWSSASGDGHPLRLALVHSLIRSLGWLLDYERIADRNEYRIVLPAMNVEVL